MNRYICTSCGRFSHSAATPETARNDSCAYPGCGGHVIPAPEGQKCRVCGCTWEQACPGGCYWSEPDLCSSCVEKERVRGMDQCRGCEYEDYQNSLLCCLASHLGNELQTLKKALPIIGKHCKDYACEWRLERVAAKEAMKYGNEKTV